MTVVNSQSNSYYVVYKKRKKLPMSHIVKQCCIIGVTFNYRTTRTQT